MISEEALQIAAAEYDRHRLSRLPKPEDCVITFSRRFERRMKRLISRTDHPVRYWTQKSAACFLLALLLGGGGLLLFSPKAQAAFLGWIREFCASHFVYRYEGENPEAPEGVVCRPAWVPDGYQLVLESHGILSAHLVYQNADGDRISCGCSANHDASVYGIAVDNVRVQHFRVNGCPADFYAEQDETAASALVWADEDAGAFFYILARLPADDMIQMAESVEKQRRSQIFSSPVSKTALLPRYVI